MNASARIIEVAESQYPAAAGGPPASPPQLLSEADALAKCGVIRAVRVLQQGQAEHFDSISQALGDTVEYPWTTQLHPHKLTMTAMCEPQIAAGERCPVYGDGLCFFNYVLAAFNVKAYCAGREDRGRLVPPDQARTDLTLKMVKNIKERMYKKASACGDVLSAARLAANSSAYPESADIKYAAAIVGGAIHEYSEVDGSDVVFHHGPKQVALCVKHMTLTDPGGNPVDHVKLAQSWLPPQEYTIQEDMVDIEDLPDGVPDDSVLAQLRQRRNRPGVQQSRANLKTKFAAARQLMKRQIETVDPQPDLNTDGILNMTKRMSEFVHQKHPHWDTTWKHFAAAALCTYRLRLVDMSIREHVLVLWIIEGGRYIRSHDGTVYFYHAVGAFLPWKGFPTEESLCRVKKYLRQLEGLFRRLPANIRRDHNALLDAINVLLQSDNSADLLHKCSDASIFNEDNTVGQGPIMLSSELDRVLLLSFPVSLTGCCYVSMSYF